MLGMKPEIRERRIYMMQQFGQTFSEKQAIEATAKKFNINKDTLYTDWNRKDSWFKEIIDFKNNDNIIRQLLLDINRTLMEIQQLRKNTDNNNCKLSAYKLQLSTQFRLLDFFKNYDNEELKDRIEKLEEQAKKGTFIP
jgi:hypothetical protein